jgi:hypothetical protein
MTGGIHSIDVKENEKVDGSELSVDRGRSANLGAEAEIGSKESRKLHPFSSSLIACDLTTVELGLRIDGDLRMEQPLFREVPISGEPFVRILTGQGAASKEESLLVVLHVFRQPLPKQEEHLGVSMSRRNAGAPQFDRLVNDAARKAREIKFLRGIKPERCGGHRARLNAIRADWLSTSRLIDSKVVTGTVVLIAIEASEERRFESLAQLDVEDIEAKAQYVFELLTR